MSCSEHVYVASSWRNEFQPQLVDLLRVWGFRAYDFRNPAPGNTGFSWAEIDPDWEKWTVEQYLEALEHPLAILGFGYDMDNLRACDTCLLVQPCGRSAHLELGWAVGAGKKTGIWTFHGEPELMVKMVDWMGSTKGLRDWLENG